MSKSESVHILLKIIKEIEDKNFKLQQICNDNKVLFKPWPSRKENVKEITDSNTNSHGEEKEKEALTSEEQTGLEMMEKILTKAQKARNVQKKLSESKPHGSKLSPKSSKLTRTNEDKMSPKSHDKSLDEDESCGTLEKNTKNTEILERKIEKEKSSCDENVDKSSCHQKNYPSQTSCKIGGDNSRKTSVNKTSVIKSAGKSKTEKRTDRYVGNRTGSASDKGKKIVPAYMKAPFKTNPAVSNPKRPVYRRPASGTQSFENSKNIGVLSKNNRTLNKELPSIKNTVKCDITEDLSNSETVINQDKDKSMDDVHSSEEDNRNINSVNTEASQPQINVKDVSKKVKNMKVQDTSKPTDEPEMPFCLFHDGESLTLPANLKRLQGNNMKLRQKFDTERVTRKVDVSQSGQDFISKLEASCESKEEAMIGQKVCHIHQSYSKLLRLFNNINLEKISEDSSCYEVLKARKYLEFILASFHQLEEDRLNLDPTLLKRITTITSYDTSSVHIHPELRKSDWQWLPSCLPTDGVTYIPPMPHVVQYRHHKDLHRFTYLLFQIQYLQLQLSLTDIVAKETIPLLQSMDTTSRDYVNIFRSVYSMLSPGSFSVIVKDTIQELDQSMDCDET